MFITILYVLAFVIVGIPALGYSVKKLTEFGKYVYREYPFIAKFFDQYWDHFGVGFIITLIAVVSYFVGRWIGIF